MKKALDNTIAALGLLQDFTGENSKFSDELKKRILSKDIGLEEAHYFGVKNITGEGGKIQLIDDSSEKVYGKSNISKNKLSKNKAFLCDRVGFFVAKGNESTPGTANFENKGFENVLKNTILEIRQNDKNVFSRPCSDSAVSVTAQNPEEKYVELRVPFALADDLDFEINLQFPKNTSMPTEEDADLQYLVKWAFLGYSTKLK